MTAAPLSSFGRYPPFPQVPHACHWRDALPRQLAVAKEAYGTTLPFGSGLSYGDSCLAVSDHGRRYLLHYGMPPERIAICPIPVDVDRFRRTAAASTDQLRRVAERYGDPADRPVVAFCGKLVPGKRPLDLARAAARLDVTALFIGDGELRRAILAEGAGRAIVTGFVNRRTRDR